MGDKFKVSSREWFALNLTVSLMPFLNAFAGARMQQSNASSGPKRQLLNSLNLQPIDAGIALPHHHHHQQNEDGVHSDNGESSNEMCIKTEDLIIGRIGRESRGIDDQHEELILIFSFFVCVCVYCR